MSTQTTDFSDIDAFVKAQQAKDSFDDIDEFVAKEKSAPKKLLPEVESAIRSVPRPELESGGRTGVMETLPTLTSRGGPVAVTPEAKQYESDLAKSSPQVLPHPAEMAADIAVPGAGQVAQGAREVATPGKRLHGVADIASGAGEAISPIMGPAALENPLPVAAGLGTGLVSQEAGGRIAHAAGASPQTEEDIRQLAFWAPNIAGMLAGAAGIEGAAEITPEAKAAGLSAFGGQVKAGVGITPEEIRIGGKLGPFEGTKSFARGTAPAGPALEPQTIEGQVAEPKAPPPSDDPAIAPPQVSAAPAPSQPPEIAQAASDLTQIQQQEQLAHQIVTGTVPPPPAPPAPPAIHEVTPQMVQDLGGIINRLPENVRAQAILETHQTLSKMLLAQGRFVGPDGQVEIVDNPKQAEKVAQKIINEEIGRQDEEAAKPHELDEDAVQKLQAAEPHELDEKLVAKLESEHGTAAESKRSTQPLSEGGDDTRGTLPATGRVRPEPSTGTRQPIGQTNSAGENTSGRPVFSAAATAPAGLSGSEAAGERENQLQSTPKTFQKGDQVVLPDGSKATVTYTHPKMAIARVMTESGQKKSIGLKSLKPYEAKPPVVLPKPAAQPVAGPAEIKPVPQAQAVEGVPRGTAPQAGSAEYEALRQKVAALESKRQPAAPANHAETLRSAAQSLQSQIDAKRNPAIANQNLTARRSRIAEGMGLDADRMEEVRRRLSALADAHDAGSVPESLRGVRNRTQLETVLRNKELPHAWAHSSIVRELIEKTKLYRGTANDRSVLSRTLGRGETGITLYGNDEVGAFERLLKVAQEHGVKTSSWNYHLDDYKRAMALGLDTPEKFAQAHKDMVELGGQGKRQPSRDEQVKKAERELIGQKIPGFFPTPKPVIEKMLDEADIRPGDKVLEPSAGKGDIADAIKEQAPEAKLDTVEQQSSLRKILELKGHNIAGSDFLEHKGEYDKIVMNPPFEAGQDMQHVKRAYELLKPDGRLVSIMSPHFEFAGDQKSIAFRDWLDSVGGRVEKLPEGSFTGKDSFRQTGTASRMVVIDKPESSTPVPAEEPKAESILTGESGTFEPGKIGEAAKEVSGFLAETREKISKSRDIHRGIYSLESAYSADVLRAVQTMKSVTASLGGKAEARKDFATIYHHLENPEGVSLTPNQDKVLDNVVFPLMEESNRIYEKLSGGGEGVENYIHRVVKNKGSFFDRILSGSKSQGRGNLLSKSAPQTKGRTMMALEDERGNRRVVSLKGGQVTAWTNGSPENLGPIMHSEEGRVFEDKDGHIWKLTQATTKEIEQHTDLSYYHNALASAMVSYLQLRKAERGFDFVNELKSDPTFKKLSVAESEGNPPKGWKPLELPQLRGYVAEPRIAEVLNDYAARLKSDGPDIYDKITRFLRTAMLVNPLIHPLNVGASWALEKGAIGLMPHRWIAMGSAGAKAIKAVWTQNEDFLKALDAGAPLQSHREATEQITRLFFDQLSDASEKGENWAVKAVKALGFDPNDFAPGVGPIHKVASKVAWMASDILFLQSAYEHQKAGMSLADALKEVGRIIPEYRLPTRIFDSRSLGKLLGNRKLTLFSAYHYGLLRGFAEMGKSMFGAHQPPPGQSRAKDIAHGWSMFALAALVVAGLYPLLDEELRKLTGDKDATVKRYGPFGIINNLWLLHQKEKSPTDVATSIVTPNPLAEGAGELIMNRSLHTGRQIYDPQADGKTITGQILHYGSEIVSPVGQVSRAANQPEGWKKYGYGWLGVTFPRHGAEKVAQEIAASKGSTSAGSEEGQQKYYVRQRIIDGLRKGDRKPLEESQNEFSRSEIHAMEQRARHSWLQDKVHGFTYQETMRVYNAPGATEEQKRELEPILREKRRNLLHRHRGDEVAKVESTP